MFIRCLYAALGMLFAMALTGAAAANQKAKDEPSSQSIAPGKIHEICITLKPKEHLRYSFTATEKLSFNIHYHTGHKVNYHVSERMTSESKGTFKPISEQKYCLMWTNWSSASVELHVAMEKSTKAK